MKRVLAAAGITLLAAVTLTATFWPATVSAASAGQEQQSPLIKMPDGSEFLPEYAKSPSMFRPASDAPNNILIDAPANNTIYPPDLIPPQFKWRDNNAAATVWRIEIAFEKGQAHPRLVQRRKTADRRTRHRPQRLRPSHPQP